MTTRLSVSVVAALCASAGLGLGAASAQVTDPTPNNNCDITHQEIQDTHNAGQVGGIYGYAWGSYTCNLGSDALSWVSGGSPALAMNAYRLSDGRLVQIGLGFCKHACCAGNGAGCGTCSTTGTGLRAGCRDIYSASFNAGQTRLGPRSGIDPYLGTFNAIAPLPSGSSAIYRKVQVPATEMSLATYPTALYFAEGVYVCREEKPSAQLNNATYRRMSVANTGTAPTYAWSVATGSASQMGQPAIYAWRDHGNGANTPDNSVVIVTADVPNDGRFYAAGKVRDLSGTGAGPWHYEYAVFNLNSSRAAGSLSVAVPSGALVTNIGFHDIDYHSGEIYDNTDWTGAKTGSLVAWQSTTTFDTNPAGNALRWGTMYNFWFDANVAPAAAPGSLTLGLYRLDAASGVNSIQLSGLPVPTPPAPCPADFNGVGGVSPQDVFDFLAAFFNNDARADFNGVGGVSVQDLFDFLAAYFLGCP